MEISVDNTALMIVDMQNGFCHSDGSFSQLGFDITMFLGAIEGCATLVRAAHASDVPVIFTRYVYQPDYADGGLLTNELIPAIKGSNHLAAGSWDADIVDQLTPSDHDLVIDKSRYSAFYGTRLEPILTNKRIKSLVVAGVTTNMCVETTVRDASQRDYYTYTVSDATGEASLERHNHALNTIAFGFGWVVTVEDVLASWKNKSS